MEIRKIQGILISSLFVVGLAGCSNSPSWRDADNSPWKTKRDSEDTSFEEFVELSPDDAPFAETTMPEPERESMFEIEPVLTEPGLPEPVEEIPAPSVIGSDIMSAPASAYVVQAYAGRKLNNVNGYMSSHDLDQMQIVKTNRDGDILYVLVSLHDGLESAKQASFDLEQRTGSKPWVRSVTGLQRIFSD
ncbi:MAG: hypothetical protein ABUK13_03570 [Gammaproteobacteria bacterium]